MTRGTDEKRIKKRIKEPKINGRKKLYIFIFIYTQKF